MKETFPGYFPITEKESAAFWKDGLFSVDANVLLGVYRYSDGTRKELLRLFKALGNRMWVTHQAAQEFLDGRLGVIGAQSKLYDDSIVLIDRVESMFKSARGHPFLTDDLLRESEAHFKKLRSYLIGKKSYLDGLVSKDSIQESVAELLKSRIGAAFSKERLQKIAADGDIRYKNKVPPGYEDAKKPEANDRFGDLIMWFQLIEKAHKEKKPITFVTADEKEDWWKKFQGKTIGPRPELVAEMASKAGVTFQMLSPERFMEVANDKLSRVNEAAIREVKELREVELSPGAMEILRALDQEEKLKAQFGLIPPAALGLSAYEKMFTDQEKLKAQLGLIPPGAAGLSAYEKMFADQEKLKAELGMIPPAALGLSAYEKMFTDQEKLKAQLGLIPPGALGLSAYEKMFADQEKLKAQLGIKKKPKKSDNPKEGNS